MGEFQDGQFITSAALADDGRAGSPAGVHAHEREPMARRGLAQAAKGLFPPAGPREDEPPPAPFEGRSKSERRDITRASEFYASVPDDIDRVREALAGEMATLDVEAGPSEDGAERSRETVALINDFADSVDRSAAELQGDQQRFIGWAAEQAGGQQELLDWLGEQEDQQGALQALAEEYIGEAETDAEFTSWVASAIGEEGIAQIDAMSDEDRTEVLGELAEAFADEVAGDDDYDDDDYGDFDDEED